MGSTIAGAESLKYEPATSRVDRHPTGRSSLWLPSSTIRVCVPWHPPPFAKFAKFANFSSFL